MFKAFLFFCSFFMLVCVVQAADYKALFQQAQQAEQAQQWSQALDLYHQAVQANPPEKPKNIALFQYFIGTVQQRLQHFAEAESAFLQSLQWREAHLGENHGAVAVSLNGLAGVYDALGDVQRALPLYQRALRIDEKNHGLEHRKIAVDLNNLAETYRKLGQFSQAEPLLKRALEIDKQAWGLSSPRIAVRLSNLAELYRQQGRYAQAKALLLRALDIDQAALNNGENDVLNLAIRHNNLGRLYVTLGDYAQADTHYRQALDIWRERLGDSSAQYAVGLNNRAWVAQVLAHYPQAEAFYREALRINENTYGQAHPAVATTLHNLALLLTEQEQYLKALPLFERAKIIWTAQLGAEHPHLAMLLHNRAKLKRAQGEYVQAEEDLRQAIAIAKTAEQPALLWAVLDNLSQTLATQGQTDAAILVGKQAINTLQHLRVNVAQLEKPLQRTFLQDKAGIYQRLASLLLEAGRIPEAQQVQRMLKEEEYYDFVRREPEQAAVRVMTASFNPTEKPWVQRAQTVYERLSNIGQQLKKIRLKPRPSSEEQATTQRLRGAFKQQQHALQQYFSELKTQFDTQALEHSTQQALRSDDQKQVAMAREYQALRQKTRLSPEEQTRKQILREQFIAARRSFNACLKTMAHSTDVAVQHLDTEQALQGTLRTLGHGAVLVHYVMAADKLHIILTTPNVQLCREANISAAQLKQDISQFRDFFKQPPDPRRPHLARFMLEQAHTLYQHLIKPIAADLAQAEAKTLMLSLDGELRYLPMAALHDGQQYLAEHYAVVIFTEAARDKLKDVPLNTWRIAGLGVSKALRNMNALPSVEQELESIIRHGAQDPDGVAPGAIKLNEDFNQLSLLGVLEQGYPVLHIASHFVFQPRTDEDAYLLLGNGEILSLADIRVGYDFNGVDLLTLSACQTAVGSLTQGQEVEGLGALAQKQGARSVIATLWPVDDRSTGLFMQHFYQVHETQPGVTKVAALQQVQQAFIQAAQRAQQTQIANNSPLYPADFIHPYYWAPFVLMGNWL